MCVTSDYVDQRLFFMKKIIIYTFILQVVLIQSIYGQMDTVRSLLEPNHYFGESEYEKEVFLEVEKELDLMSYNGFFVEDDLLLAYISGIYKKIIPKELNNFKITPHVLKSPIINAGAYPTGDVVINVGLLAKMQNEGQLAFILSHELAHFIYRHSLIKYIYRQKLDKKYKSVFFGKRNAKRQREGLSSYSIDVENAADSLGLILFEQAGYDPIYAYQAMQNLPEPDSTFQLPKIIVKLFGFTPSMPTHPKLQSRIDFVGRHLSPEHQPIVPTDETDEKYQQQIKALQIQNIKLLRSLTGIFSSFTVFKLEKLRDALDDTESDYYKTLQINIAEAYQEIMAKPDDAAMTFYWLKKKEEKGKSFFVYSRRKALAYYKNERKAQLLKMLHQAMSSLLDDPKFGYLAHRVLGKIEYQEGHFAQAREHFESYLRSTKPLKDKRYIKSLLKTINHD